MALCSNSRISPLTILYEYCVFNYSSIMHSLSIILMLLSIILCVLIIREIVVIVIAEVIGMCVSLSVILYFKGEKAEIYD